jgi:hypothetical protein
MDDPWFEHFCEPEYSHFELLEKLKELEIWEDEEEEEEEEFDEDDEKLNGIDDIDYDILPKLQFQCERLIG